MPETSPATSLPPVTDPYETLQACRQLMQRGVAGILTRCGGFPPTSIQVAAEAVGRFFDEVAAARRAGFEAADGLTASRISLVCDDELELEIVLNDMSRRLAEGCNATLWRLLLRFATLLQRPDFSSEDNPLSPEGICQGIGEMCIDMGGGMSSWTPLIKRIEERLQEDLPALYGEINEFLTSRKIAPARAPGPQRQRDAGPSQAEGSAATAPDPFAKLQETLLRQFGGGEAAGGGSGKAMAGAGAEATGNAQLATVPVELLNRLLSRLELLDQIDLSGLGLFDPPAPSQPAAPAAAPADSPVAAPKPNEAAQPLDSQRIAELDALGLTFDALFANQSLPDAIKATVGSLQTPTIKAAIRDPDFFGADTHPARQLIDAMARASVGLPLNVDPDHYLCKRLQEVAATVKNRVDENPNVFESAISEVEALQAHRNHEIQQMADTFVPLLEELSKRERFAAMTGNVVNNFLMRKPPALIADFLRGYWQPYLKIVALEHGQESAQWRDAVAVVEELLWSVQPKDKPEDRRLLAQQVPNMLRRLNAGLDRIGVGKDERNPFLDGCFALQTAAIRGLPLPDAPSPPMVVPTPSGLTANDIAINGLTLRSLDLAGGKTSLAGIQAAWKVGDWITFQVPLAGALCGRLSFLDPITGRALLINPQWGFAVAITPQLLDSQLRTRDASILAATSVFETAAMHAMEVIPTALSTSVDILLD